MAGRKLTDADLRARNRLILEARSQGRTWAEIAGRFGLSESAAKRGAAAAAKLVAEQGLADIDAGALLEQIVRAEARALYRLEELTYRANENAAIGACRGIGIVGADLRRSLAACGLIRDERGDELWLRQELRTVAGAFMDAVEKAGISPDVVEAALADEPALAGRLP